jgi:hypothetical protein
MRRRAAKPLVALLPILALAACQDPDVGTPCTISWSPTWEQDGTPPPPTAVDLASQPGGGADYFESGNLACEGLVCVISPAATGPYASQTPGQGYCSKPCVSNDDCFEDETGLVCRQMVLDPVFLEQLDPATRDRSLADIQFSSYCGVPR